MLLSFINLMIKIEKCNYEFKQPIGIQFIYFIIEFKNHANYKKYLKNFLIYFFNRQ